MGFGFLAVIGIFAGNPDLPAVFVFGTLVLAGLCLVIALACFAPRSRSWALPLVAGTIVALIVLARIAKSWRG